MAENCNFSQSEESTLNQLRDLLVDVSDYLEHLKELHLAFYHSLSISDDKPALAWTIVDACYPPAEAALDEATVSIARALQVLQCATVQKETTFSGSSQNGSGSSENGSQNG